MKTRFRKFPWKFDPSDKKVEGPFLCRSQDSPQMTSWRVRCIAVTPRKHKKYLSRPFSGQRCGSYQKSECSDWILNFSRPLRPVRDHIALGPSALGEKKVTNFPEISRKFEGLGLETVSRNLTLSQQKCGPGPTLELLDTSSLRTHRSPCAPSRGREAGV